MAGKSIFEAWGHVDLKTTRRRAPQCVGERESELALALLFIRLSLPGPVLCKLGQPGVFTRGPHSCPRTFFCFIFAGFSLPCLVATTILDSFPLFYLPNTSQLWIHVCETASSAPVIMTATLCLCIWRNWKQTENCSQTHFSPFQYSSVFIDF